MFKLRPTKSFDRSYKKIVKNNKKLEKKGLRTFLFIRRDPFYLPLHTHKVNTQNYGLKYSSRVTGDIRIIWDFDKKVDLILLLLDIGGHSGKRRVY